MCVCGCGCVCACVRGCMCACVCVRMCARSLRAKTRANFARETLSRGRRDWPRPEVASAAPGLANGPARPPGRRRRVRFGLNWSNGTTGQTAQLVKRYDWSNGSTGQTAQLVKRLKWSNSSTGQTARLVKHRSAAPPLRPRGRQEGGCDQPAPPGPALKNVIAVP